MQRDLVFSWRRGSESNRRIKVLQTFTQLCQISILFAKYTFPRALFAGFLPCEVSNVECRAYGGHCNHSLNLLLLLGTTIRHLAKNCGGIGGRL